MGINKRVGERKTPETLGYVPANSVPATVNFCWIQVPIQFSIVKVAVLLAMAVVNIRP
jgi:hypothetical protein